MGSRNLTISSVMAALLAITGTTMSHTSYADSSGFTKQNLIKVDHRSHDKRKYRRHERDKGKIFKRDHSYRQQKHHYYKPGKHRYSYRKHRPYRYRWPYTKYYSYDRYSDYYDDDRDGSLDFIIRYRYYD